MHNLSQKLLNYSTDKVGLSACVNGKRKKKKDHRHGEKCAAKRTCNKIKPQL